MSYRPIGRPKVVSDPLGRLPHINQYWQKIRALGPIAYWPLWDAAGATTAIDLMGLGNGTPSNVTFGATGVGDGKTAASFNGTSSYVNIYSAALNTAFKGAAGSVALWAKVSGSGIWSDSTLRHTFRLYVDVNNQVIIRRGAANGYLSWIYIAGGTAKTVDNSGFSSTDFIHLVITWSKANDELKAYVNGGKAGATASGLGTWAGNLNSANCAIGAQSIVPANVWSGSIGHVAIFDKVLTHTQIATMSSFYRISAIGDSITADPDTWISTVCTSLGVTKINHAYNGATIITDGDADPDLALQASYAAEDNANIIIIAMGTNDDNAGNMTTLQTEYETQVAALKVSNPTAIIYAMNLLPRWTDNTTGPEVDKSNIRTAIAAACTSQGITCWDTYTTPWIAQNETSDGLHPTAAGHAAIAAEVLARL